MKGTAPALARLLLVGSDVVPLRVLVHGLSVVKGQSVLFVILPHYDCHVRKPDLEITPFA